MARARPAVLEAVVAPAMAASWQLLVGALRVGGDDDAGHGSDIGVLVQGGLRRDSEHASECDIERDGERQRESLKRV